MKFSPDNFGLIPYRRPIVTVGEPRSVLETSSLFLFLTCLVGRPIHTEKKEKPTLEELAAVQRLYIEELTR